MPPWKNGAFWADWTFGFCRSKFRGAFILLFCFQGGLKNAVIKSGGHFLSSQIFQGGFFRIKNSSGAQQKKSGGLASYVWKFRGAYFYNLSWSEKAPLNSRRFLLRNFRCAGIAGLNPCQHVIIFVNFWQSLNLFFLSHKQHLKAFRNALPSCVS